jgi:hypothetical protein
VCDIEFYSKEAMVLSQSKPSKEFLVQIVLCNSRT